MTIKFTKCGVGAESGDETLLFEFLDHECPEFIELEYISDLVRNKFIGSLQTNQHNGIFLEPITFEFEFYGTYIGKHDNILTAKDRFDQLARLQGRAIKFWYEGIKQIVIIEKLKPKFHNYYRVTGSITIAPHDLQVAIKPDRAEQTNLSSFIFASSDTTAGEKVDKNGLGYEILNKVTDMPFKDLQAKIKAEKLEVIDKYKKELMGYAGKVAELQTDIDIRQGLVKKGLATATDKTELQSLLNQKKAYDTKSNAVLRQIGLVEKGTKDFQAPPPKVTKNNSGFQLTQ